MLPLTSFFPGKFILTLPLPSDAAANSSLHLCSQVECEDSNSKLVHGQKVKYLSVCVAPISKWLIDMQVNVLHNSLGAPARDLDSPKEGPCGIDDPREHSVV